MVEVYKFPIDEVPDIIAIKRITATEVEVHHVEEDENGKETRCDKLKAHNTKKLSLGMVKWDEVDKALDTIVKPIESLSKLPNALLPSTKAEKSSDDSVDSKSPSGRSKVLVLQETHLLYL